MKKPYFVQHKENRMGGVSSSSCLGSRSNIDRTKDGQPYYLPHQRSSVTTKETSIDVAPTSSPTTPSSKAQSAANSDQHSQYAAFHNGMSIYCLDHFRSKYTGEPMARWRKAVIMNMDHTTLLAHIHFEGWKDKYDINLDLKSELYRLAPGEILTDKQKTDGESLDVVQYRAVTSYAAVGRIPSDVTLPVTEIESVGAQAMYSVGEKVDVRDIYKPKGKKTGVVFKWRPGEIRNVSGVHVHVHYIGWGEEWDEVIDTSIEGNRIKPPGTETVPRGSARHTRHNREHRTSRNTPNSSSSRRRRSCGEVEASPPSKEVMLSRSVPITRSHTDGHHNTTTLRSAPDMPRGEEERKTTKGMVRTRSFPGPASTSPGSRHPNAASPEELEELERMQKLTEEEYVAAMKNEAAFVEALNNRGLHVVEVDGDGNCLFRAVAHQIWLDEDRHLDLRKKVVDHMQKHAARYASFCADDFKEHLQHMRMPGVWGDDLEIRALEEITDRLIVIYSSHSPTIEPLNTNFDEARHMKGVKPIILSYHGKNHYNSVYDVNTPLPLQPRRSKVLLDLRRKHQVL